MAETSRSSSTEPSGVGPMPLEHRRRLKVRQRPADVGVAVVEGQHSLLPKQACIRPQLSSRFSPGADRVVVVRASAAATAFG